MPTRCQNGAKKLTFRSLKCHFGVPHRREWPLVKTSAGAMFSSHYEGPGPSLFAPKIDSGTHSAPGVLFFTLLSPLLVPKWNPKAPQGSPKEPTRDPKPPQGHLKSIKKSTKDPTWAPRGAREAPRGTPGKENEPKSTKKHDFFTAPRHDKIAQVMLFQSPSRH